MNLGTLADRLKFALARKGISQSELARRIGIKPQAIQYLCSGRGHKSGYIAEIARELEIRPHWLATGQGPMEAEPGERIVYLPDYLVKIARAVAEAPPETLEKILADLGITPSGEPLQKFEPP